MQSMFFQGGRDLVEAYCNHAYANGVDECYDRPHSNSATVFV
jgi:hypothetical protein